jgi:hypothetical protein
VALRIALAIVLPLPVFLAVSVRPARGDFVSLRNGGEVRGELLTDPKSKARGEVVTIRSLSGAIVSIGKLEVDAVVRRRMAVEEYETRRRELPDTVQAHTELAEWCRQKTLPKERESHLRRTIELDPENVAAHRALGHIRHQGRWSTQDEVMTSRGYVKYKGKYLLPQELEMILQDERVTESEKGWFKRVKMWHGWLNGENGDRRSEALSQLNSIREPDAVAALARSFRGEPDDDLRLLYVKTLGRISGDRPLPALVSQSLWDESNFVRDAAIKGVRSKDVNKAIPMYVRALKNAVNAVVNRAGAALGQIGEEKVIPQLIDALVTRHEYIVMVPEGGIGIPSGGMIPVGTSPLPPQIEGLLATGQLPYGVNVQAPANAVRMKEVTIYRDEENQSVLQALVLLTGEALGFDEPAWKKWYNSQHNSAGAKTKKKARP